MTVSFILLSYIQILLLPGFLYCSYKKRFDLFQIISISIFFNYLIIIFISNFLFDKKIFLLCLVILEFILIIYFLIFLEKKYVININLDNYKIINLSIIIFIIFKLSQAFNQHIGTLFNEGDVFLSWNEWSYNLLGSSYTPEYLTKNNFDSSFKEYQSRSYYGQLIPANWSIFYALTNMTDITMYPKFLNFIFSFLAIVYLIQKYFKENNIFYIILLFLISYFFFKEHAHIVYSGLVDGSLAIFIFLSLTHVFNYEKKFKEVNLFISILFAAIATNIKILSLYYSVIFLPIYIFYNYNKILKKKLFFYLSLLIVTSLFWPIYQFIIYGNNIFITNNLEYLSSLSVTNFSEGIDRLSTLFGNKVIFILFFLILFLSLFQRKINLITIFLVIPYLLIWYFFASYDIRNILLIIPISCFIVSYTIVQFVAKFSFFINKNIFSKKVIFNQKFINGCIFSLLILILLTFVTFHETFDKNLNKDILNKKKLIKNEGANNYILMNLDKIDLIYTDYIYLKYVLNLNDTNKINICNMFQKENTNHCNFNKSTNIVLITYYGDNLKKKFEKKFKLNLLETFKNINIYSIN